MQVAIIADKYKKQQGYKAAVVELPAGRTSIADAFQRARISETDHYKLCDFYGWSGFLSRHLILSGHKTVDEVNLLAYKINQMDRMQIETYEGALQLRENADIDTPISTRELINILYNLEQYSYMPGILNDQMLGEMCLMGELVSEVKGVSDEVFEMLSEEKVGQYLRRCDQGEFTRTGYVLCDSKEWQEVYDGRKLPEQPDVHNGMLSLQLEAIGNHSSVSKHTWLELPADDKAMQSALTALGVTSFADCVITESISAIPGIENQLGRDEDIDKLNILASKVEAFADGRTLAKYKAVLEVEQCNDIDMQLDIADNLACYDFDDYYRSPADYAKQLFGDTGVDVSDPAFDVFDFYGYGSRQLELSGLHTTSYGDIRRNEIPFVPEYTKPQMGMTMQ